MIEKTELKITSPAFKNDGEIPSKYTCDGEGVNPALHINNIPEDAKTLALIVEDPDAPNGTFDHWVVWNIDPVTTINEHSLPGTSGDNSAGKSGYHPPCPPFRIASLYFQSVCIKCSIGLACRYQQKRFATGNGGAYYG